MIVRDALLTPMVSTMNKEPSITDISLLQRYGHSILCWLLRGLFSSVILWLRMLVTYLEGKPVWPLLTTGLAEQVITAWPGVKGCKGDSRCPSQRAEVPAEEDQKASLGPTKNTQKQTMEIKYSATPKDKAIKKNDFGTNGTEINRVAGPREGCS